MYKTYTPVWNGSIHQTFTCVNTVSDETLKVTISVKAFEGYFLVVDLFF